MVASALTLSLCGSRGYLGGQCGSSSSSGSTILVLQSGSCGWQKNRSQHACFSAEMPSLKTLATFYKYSGGKKKERGEGTFYTEALFPMFGVYSGVHVSSFMKGGCLLMGQRLWFVL